MPSSHDLYDMYLKREQMSLDDIYHRAVCDLYEIHRRFGRSGDTERMRGLSQMLKSFRETMEPAIKGAG